MYMYLLDSKYIFKFIAEKLISVKKDCKKCSPTPGIEPGPPGWKPGILAIRPRGIDINGQTAMLLSNILIFLNTLHAWCEILLLPN